MVYFPNKEDVTDEPTNQMVYFPNKKDITDEQPIKWYIFPIRKTLLMSNQSNGIFSQ